MLSILCKVTVDINHSKTPYHPEEVVTLKNKLIIIIGKRLIFHQREIIGKHLKETRHQLLQTFYKLIKKVKRNRNKTRAHF